MKIIDLLNKIANGEEVPYRIKIKGTEYWFNDENKQYIYVPSNEISSCDDLYSNTLILSYELSYEETLTDFLNTEVEILEEEKKIPEKIDVISWDKCIHNVTYKEKELAIQIYKTQELLNQVIDYLKSKGDDKE